MGLAMAREQKEWLVGKSWFMKGPWRPWQSIIVATKD